MKKFNYVLNPFHIKKIVKYFLVRFDKQLKAFLVLIIQEWEVSDYNLHLVRKLISRNYFANVENIENKEL